MFNKKLKQSRAERNLSQEQMANWLGVSTRTYMDYENGKNEPKISVAKKIAEILEMPLSELINEYEDLDKKTAHEMMLFMKSLDEEDKNVIRKIMFGLRLRKSFMNKMSEEEDFLK
ncbi:helix-turn-helix domain-containing protein [Vibrio parahaemolyticus]|uniref:helix-turn-helix transcriptional regulator n=1 Tax=Vibrio harveyi group TaxID=717610 RepID=UPI00215C323B|nr:helix-turn-helix transcriptional regulator [Vibrio parahaemolyticus]EJL6606006.1 helix-turn-helix transcriptional regulator [Vibrio cholerae]MCR9650173.1 helix-turn-helix domain-containing protein [Vibrio parahaemolyticus]